MTYPCSAPPAAPAPSTASGSSPAESPPAPPPGPGKIVHNSKLNIIFLSYKFNFCCSLRVRRRVRRVQPKWCAIFESVNRFV